MMAQEPLPAAAQQALTGLVEIATPPAVSWMPQTWGWAVLGVLLLAAAAAWLWRWRRAALANRYRAEALEELTRLRPLILSPATRSAALVTVAELIKRTALSAYTRPRVARLSGAEWVAFVRERGFPESSAMATLLNDAEYRREESSSLSGAEAVALLSATREWITRHRVPA